MLRHIHTPDGRFVETVVTVFNEEKQEEEVQEYEPEYEPEDDYNQDDE